MTNVYDWSKGGRCKACNKLIADDEISLDMGEDLCLECKGESDAALAEYEPELDDMEWGE